MTAQVHEIIIINGEKSSMAFCPPVPFLPGIVKMRTNEEINEDIRNFKVDSIVRTTACWRGYVGTWEIKDNKFYLKELAGCFQLVKNEPVHATWFTGVLRVPQGKILHYVHMGFGSIYEKELHIKIVAGDVTDQRTIDNTEKLKERTPGELLNGFCNLPGMENLFPGDDF